ncbi:MAG: alpha/beta hydrolase [Clostridia bacterium]|nr:alpha/beta hydrolase [Clostridia bacterium]
MIERFGVCFAPGMDERVISVYLPVGYGACDARYPVMYMLDGQNAFEEEKSVYGKSFNLHTFMTGWEKEMIIVGIESSTENDRRLAEYCPYALGRGRWEGLHARGDETMRWIEEELKPIIDGRYRTMSNRACTGIIGAATGGLLALYAVAAFNHVFSKAACISPAICSCHEQIKKQIRMDGIDADTRVYLSMGENEARDKPALARMMGRILGVGDALMHCGARVEMVLQENGRHCEADWRMQTERFMRFLWLEG